MMKLKYLFFIMIGFYYGSVFSQGEKEENLNEIVLSSNRIEIPFKESSRTIQVISRKEIDRSTANNVAELLQQFAGIDVRQRGIEGMQSDLYIRGGSFDQTLVLIDGIKTENPQTGHHTMNIMIPLENIERIEIIKGPAARIYGQNAFTGAINIITKKNINTQLEGRLSYGSFSTSNLGVTGGVNLKKSSHLLHYSRNISDGYRYNTDFKNNNFFLKSKINVDNTTIDIIGMFMDRKFGANGFYANPDFKDQYEETQSSLVGFSTIFSKKNLTIKPKLYWKRGQDMYEFVRGKPEIYRNLHITNKIGGEISSTIKTKLGTTGLGLDLARVSISSNNLGDHQRVMLTGYFEQRILMINDKLDITPGLAVTYYSDFDFQAFPGIDLGYQISKQIKLYSNMGYTYRIPTYTDLYYTDPTTIGNVDLKPEKALSGELGVKYVMNKLLINIVAFNRNSTNLIDYVKENEEDKWMAVNLAEVNTFGVETQLDYQFNIKKYPQQLNLGYTYLNDEIKKQNIQFSRYSLNSMRHQITANLGTQFLQFLKHNLIFRFVERPDGTSYNILDFKLTAIFNDFEISGTYNNIFNTEYTETNLVPMPKGNAFVALKYVFK